METLRVYDFTSDEEGVTEVSNHMRHCIALDLGFTVELVQDFTGYAIIRMSVFSKIRENT